MNGIYFDSRRLHVLLSGVFLFVGAACTDPYGNYQYSGESRIYPIVPVPMGTLPIADFGRPGQAFSEPGSARSDQSRYYLDLALEDPGSRTLTIRINRAYMKYLADLDPSKEILAYVEVVDYAEPSKKFKRVFFENEFDVQGKYLNFNSKIVYGPRPFLGRPIEVNFFVYELDQKENEVATKAVQEIKQTLALLGPQVSAISNPIADVVVNLIGINVDDRELQFNCTLLPATTTHPDAADFATQGSLLRTGNYVLVKEEKQRAGASKSSTLSFDDERSFPAWLPTAQKKVFEVWKWPNVVYLGGELKITRVFQRLLRDLDGGPSTPTDALIRRLSQESDFSMFTRSASPTITYNHEVATFQAPETSMQNTKFPKGMKGPPGSNDTSSSVPDVDSVPDVEGYIDSNYVAYTSKSYISFTVQDRLSMADPNILGQQEKEDAERIAQIVPTLTAEQLKAVIGSIGESMRGAVVQFTARRRLRTKNTPDDINAEVKALKEQFGDIYGVQIRAEADLRTARIMELQHRTGKKAEQLEEFRKGIERILPDLKQFAPHLAVFAETFLNDNILPVPTTQPDGQ